MIAFKKWPWVLGGTLAGLALWTFLSIGTYLFNTGGSFEYFTYLSSYVLVIAVWAVMVFRFEISAVMRRIIGITLFAFSPFFCMQIMMLFSGAVEYTYDIYFINLMFYVSFLGVYLALTRNFSLSGMLTVTTAYLFNMVTFVINILRGTPIIPSDILAIGTAMQVARNYSFHMRFPIIAATIITLAFIALSIKFYHRPKFKFRHIILPICGIAVAAGFFISLGSMNYDDVDMDFFDQYHANNTHGTIYSFYINIRKMILTQPEGYDPNEADKLLASYKTEANPEEIKDGDKPNIIVIMNESFSELKVVGDYETDADYMANTRALTENTIKGQLLVSPFGGNTCNTEFEFLTGLSMGLLPSGSTPYLQYISKPYDFALPAYMSKLGYETVGIHPYYGRCWNRQTVYKFLGFDRFVSLDNFDELVPEDDWELVRNYMSDRTSFKGVTTYLEEKEKGKPAFVFNVTMQNHGGYDYADPDIAPVHITSMAGAYPLAEQYLSLIRESDKAFAEFTEYLKKYDEKTLVVMFGDHQPAVEQAFFEELYGKPLSNLSTEELQQRYKVPFIIWANYDIAEAENVLSSTNFLSDIVLETAKLPKNEIGSFTTKLRTEIPRINAMGHYTSDGAWHENEESESELLKQYGYIEYYELTK